MPEALRGAALTRLVLGIVLLLGGAGLFAGVIWHAAAPGLGTSASTRISIAAPGARDDALSDPAPKFEWRAPASRPVELPYARAISGRGNEKAEPESAPPPEVQRFTRVIVEDTGTFKSGEVTIRLAGLHALTLDAHCEAGNSSWPCGRAGRGALRRLIRGRTVACTDLTRTGADEFAGRCTVAATDINQWLVRHGWARPDASEATPYREALDVAQREQRGQWRATRSARAKP